MESLLPKQHLAQKFEKPIRYEELSFAQLDAIATRKPESLFELGLSVWTHHLERAPHENPRVLERFVDRDDPYLIHAIADHLGKKILFDINYSIAQIEDNQLDCSTVSELLVAAVYPGYLHISDLQFTNPYKPIAPCDRKYRFKQYVGLGMFGVLLDSARSFAQAHGLTHISLTAAGPDLRPFFERFGFQVEENPAGRYGVESGRSIPMRLRA